MSQKQSTACPSPFRPQIELLEDRVVPAVLTVDTKDDVVNQNDGKQSLREAITAANTTAALDTIKFDIANQQSEIKLKNILGTLPEIKHPIVIDGTPPQGKPNQTIVLDGAQVMVKPDGLTFINGSANSVVKGIQLQKFKNGIVINSVSFISIGGTQQAERVLSISNSEAGILITGANATNNQVINSFLGTDGVNAKPNAVGIEIVKEASANKIGDGRTAHRNVLSGNTIAGISIDTGAHKNYVNGNYIGTDTTGARALPNQVGVSIEDSSGNHIGGARPLDKQALNDPANIVSGNERFGIWIRGLRQGSPAKDNTISGNYIGVDSTGLAILGNGASGVYLQGTFVTNTTIGGPTLHSLNVISGNARGAAPGPGIEVSSGADTRIRSNNIGIGKDRARAGAGLENGSAGVKISIRQATQVTIKENRIRFARGQKGISAPIFGHTTKDPNLIFGEGGQGIDNGAEGITLDDAPTITLAEVLTTGTHIQGTLQSTPNSDFYLEFFGNDVTSPLDAEGESFLGFTQVSTDATGLATFDVTFEAVFGNYATATSTGLAADGFTSEFSLPVQIVGNGTGSTTVGNFVWLDANENGLQDSGEVGMAGVIVRLYDSLGNLVASTVSDSNGKYNFANLNAGDYYLEFVAPAGYAFTQSYQGDSTFDSDVDPDDGRTHLFSLATGENNPFLDAGLIDVRGTVSGRVFNDLDGDGIQDSGENGFASGLSVSLYDTSNTLIASTTTDSNGSYNFDNVVPDDYFIQFGSLPSGHVFSPKDQGSDDTVDSDVSASGVTSTFTLGAQQDLDFDAGVVDTRGTIVGRVWDDTDGDGIQDAGEPGWGSNFRVDLFDSSDNYVTQTHTDANGAFSFSNVLTGNYYIYLGNPPLNYAYSPQNQGSDDSLDSDVDLSGATAIFTLGASQTIDQDAGLKYDPISVSGRVWVDVNGNGTQESGEPGYADPFLVRLYDSTGTLVAQTTTNSNGEYTFTGLALGEYYLDFGPPPSGFTYTSPDQGSDDTLDSDVFSNGLTAALTLLPGQDKNDLDAGLDPVI